MSWEGGLPLVGLVPCCSAFERGLHVDPRWRMVVRVEVGGYLEMFSELETPALLKKRWP
jgi:hypothetical protein